MSGLALFHHWKPLFQDTCWIWCVLASGGCGFAWLLAFGHGQPFKAKATSVQETSPLVPMYFFLGTHCGGRRCALPPAPPHLLSFFDQLPLLPTLFPFFNQHRFFLFTFSFLIFIYIHRHLSLCASFLVRIAGRGAAPSPLHPPTRFYLLTGSPCYLLFFSFFHQHRLFGFILSLLKSIATCAYVLLSWYALRGEALRPPPCTPPPAFIFKSASLATRWSICTIIYKYMARSYSFF